MCLALNGLGEPTAVQAFSCQRPRALTEASLQGISPFCLTVGRHASSHLAAILGAQHDALLNRPELLPLVLLPLMLLGWMKRLVRAWAGRPRGSHRRQSGAICRATWAGVQANSGPMHWSGPSPGGPGRLCATAGGLDDPPGRTAAEEPGVCDPARAACTARYLCCTIQNP